MTSLFAGLLCIASIVAWTQRSDNEPLPCSNDGPAGTIDGVCVGGYSLVASYDALPKANQRELFRLQERLPAFESGFKGSVDSTGQFRIGGNWERRTNVVVDLETEATFTSPKNWPTVQTFLRGLGEPFYEAAKTTKGGTGEALLNAMKGQIFESPRGPMFIDAQTRDVVHNVYIRKVEKVGAEMHNVEFATITDVKDPAKTKP